MWQTLVFITRLLVYNYTHWHSETGINTHKHPHTNTVMSACHWGSHSRMRHSPSQLPYHCDDGQSACQRWVTGFDWLVLKTCLCVWICVCVCVCQTQEVTDKLVWRSTFYYKFQMFLSCKFLWIDIFCRTVWERKRDTLIRDDVDSSSVKKVSWLVYWWLAQGKLSRFYICRVCLSAFRSIHHSVSSCQEFEVTWRDCINVCLQDCFQGDVIHPPVCHMSDCHKKLSIGLSVYLTDNRLQFTYDARRLYFFARDEMSNRARDRDL